jgi:hydrogenase expression/formation protein HypE
VKGPSSSQKKRPRTKGPVNHWRARNKSGEYPQSAVVKVNFGIAKGRFLVASSDPITGATSRIGDYAVNVSGNDVATTGMMPRLLNVVALFPRKFKKKTIEEAISDIEKKTKELGATLVGTHIQTIRDLERPILTVTAVGSGDKFVTLSNARAGDRILFTKTAGLEGTSILSQIPSIRNIVGESTGLRGAALVTKISIAKEAKLAFDTGLVHAMHDVTEGGVLGAIYEMSLASRNGFWLLADKVPIDEATWNISERLDIDPLKLIGSGSLIIACPANSSAKVIRKLESNGIRCTEVGRFVPLRQGRLVQRNGKIERLSEDSIREELWDLLRKYGDLS